MSRFATLKKHNNDSLSSTQKPPNFRHLMGSRIGTASSHPMESRSVTPSAPYSTGAAQRQYIVESSRRKSEPLSLFFEHKSCNLLIFEQVEQARLVFLFWNTNTRNRRIGSAGAAPSQKWEARLVTHFWVGNIRSRRFPKMESKFHLFLSRQ